jgi:hypothetical protein
VRKEMIPRAQLAIQLMRQIREIGQCFFGAVCYISCSWLGFGVQHVMDSVEEAAG